MNDQEFLETKKELSEKIEYFTSVANEKDDAQTFFNLDPQIKEIANKINLLKVMYPNDQELKDLHIKLENTMLLITDKMVKHMIHIDIDRIANMVHAKDPGVRKFMCKHINILPKDLQNDLLHDVNVDVRTAAEFEYDSKTSKYN